MYESILVPLDGSPQAERVLPHVTSLLKNVPRVTLLSVIHRVDQLVGTRQPDPAASVEMTEDLLAREAYDDEVLEARRCLDQAKAALNGVAGQVESVIAEGDAAEEIIRVAGEVNADLIVISAFGRSASSTPTKTGVFGRVADSVLKNAKAPVLVIKPWG
jgi:nucleotide-binding universal stress UspA family protein